MTQVKINGEEIPKDTIDTVTHILGGTSLISGEAVNEEDRTALSAVLEAVSEGEVVEFFAEDANFIVNKGAGKILSIKKEEQSVGNLMRIKFSFALQYVH